MKKFYIVNIYTPNSKRELERLDYRQEWEDEIRKYLLKLNQSKPVIMCGDLNVAHKEIDLKTLRQIIKVQDLQMKREIR